jgi:hypothetical protein
MNCDRRRGSDSVLYRPLPEVDYKLQRSILHIENGCDRGTISDACNKCYTMQHVSVILLL